MSGLEPLAIAALIGAGSAAVGTGAMILRKPPAPQAAPRQVSQNTARIAADGRDRLAERQGTRANSRVGFGAGEAMTGPKTSLLGRSSNT